MAKIKENAVSKKTATSITENKESEQLLKSASKFVRDITESCNKQINRSLGVLNGFKDYAIYWEARAEQSANTFNLRRCIADFRTWIYKDNNFLLPNEIQTKEDSVAMDKLKDSKEELERLDYNRLSTSELPPQVIRDIFSKIQSIPKLIETKKLKSLREAKSISQIKQLKADLNKTERTKKAAAERTRILGDIYESKRDSLDAAIRYLDSVVKNLLSTFEDDEAKKQAAKTIVAIEKKIRALQIDLNGYFLTRVASMESDDTRLLSHKDHIAAAAERQLIWEANQKIKKLNATKTVAKLVKKSNG